MKVLVTGANGFLGQRLIKELLHKNFKVIGLTFGKNPRKNLCKDKGVTYISLDIRSSKEFNKIIKINGIEAVFHTAAFIDFSESSDGFKECFKTNVIGTFNLLNYCVGKKIKKFIYSSSVSVYNSESKSKIGESYKTAPISFYGLSKLLAEYLCFYFQKKYGIQTVVLRYAGLYGLNSHFNNAINIFVGNAIKNEDFKVFGSGKDIRDWTYVKDAIQANLLSLKIKRSGIFNISEGRGYSIKDAVRLVEKVFCSKSKIIFFKRQGKPSKIIYDISETKNILRFASTPLVKALKDIKKEYEAEIY